MTSGRRWIKLETTGGRYEVQQRMGLLTPQVARAEGLKYNWSASYLTSELGPEAVKDLLFHHIELRLKGDKDDSVKRFRVFRFLAQAGWYDEAEQQLDGILKDLPGDKDKVEADREQLKKLRLLQVFDNLEHAYKAGQHRAGAEGPG